MARNFDIRNSTTEFLIFQIEGKENGEHVVYWEERIWGTQKAMVLLFEAAGPAISKHLDNIFSEG